MPSKDFRAVQTQNEEYIQFQFDGDYIPDNSSEEPESDSEVEVIGSKLQMEVDELKDDNDIIEISSDEEDNCSSVTYHGSPPSELEVPPSSSSPRTVMSPFTAYSEEIPYLMDMSTAPFSPPPTPSQTPSQTSIPTPSTTTPTPSTTTKASINPINVPNISPKRRTIQLAEIRLHARLSRIYQAAAKTHKALSILRFHEMEGEGVEGKESWEDILAVKENEDLD